MPEEAPPTGVSPDGSSQGTESQSIAEVTPAAGEVSGGQGMQEKTGPDVGGLDSGVLERLTDANSTIKIADRQARSVFRAAHEIPHNNARIDSVPNDPNSERIRLYFERPSRIGSTSDARPGLLYTITQPKGGDGSTWVGEKTTSHYRDVDEFGNGTKTGYDVDRLVMKDGNLTVERDVVREGEEPKTTTTSFEAADPEEKARVNRLLSEEFIPRLNSAMPERDVTPDVKAEIARLEGELQRQRDKLGALDRFYRGDQASPTTSAEPVSTTQSN